MVSDVFGKEAKTGGFPIILGINAKKIWHTKKPVAPPGWEGTLTHSIWE